MSEGEHPPKRLRLSGSSVHAELSDITIISALGTRGLQHLPEVCIRLELPLRRKEIIVIHVFNLAVPDQCAEPVPLVSTDTRSWYSFKHRICGGVAVNNHAEVA